MSNAVSAQKSVKKYIGVQDLAGYLTVSVNTIRSWVWQKQIPHFKVGRLVRFEMQEIDKWLEDRKVKMIDYDKF